MTDTLILNAKIINQGAIYESDVAITDGKISKIGKDLSSLSAKKVIDAAGLHLMPGMIDDQVHFREPGLTHKEDLETGSRAAVLGGVTAVFEMPNTNPLTTSPDALAAKAWQHATVGSVESLAERILAVARPGRRAGPRYVLSIGDSRFIDAQAQI